MKGTIRKANRPGIVLGIVLCALAALSFQDKPRESVTVTAVEVPVRVFDKNGFITGLGKEDFEVFENGVKQEITGFEAVSRAISPVQVALPGVVPQTPHKRNFLLIFNVFDYTDQVGEAIDYFFKNVYHEDDRLIIVVEQRILNIETGANIDATVSRLKDSLKKYKKISRIEISKAFMDLDKKAEQTAEGGGPAEDHDTTLSGFFEYYQRVWEDYRKRLLDVDLNFYRAVIRKLDRAGGDKWAICFQQRDLFPRLKSMGRLDSAVSQVTLSGTEIGGLGAIIGSNRLRLEQSFDITRNFPADKLRTLFTEANITFHVLIMKSLYQGMISQDLALQDVRADYEDVLRRISRATGGLTVFSNKVIDSLKEAAVKEDKYYLLVYQPKDRSGRKDREIEVKVHRKGADVVALKRFVGQKPPAIMISDFESKLKAVGFTISDYSRINKGEKSLGNILVKVTVFDDQSVKVFNELKTLEPIASKLHVSLNFMNLESGDHFIIIEAADVVTGEKDVFSRAIVL